MRQILTYKVGPRTEIIKIFILPVDIYDDFKLVYTMVYINIIQRSKAKP